MEKIFIQIASYRDPELIPTIKNCLVNAKYPENLVFAIAWQHSEEDTWDNLSEFIDDERFKIIDIDYRKSKGACWARYLLQKLYDGEQWTIQLDSHHRFVKNWDQELIQMYKQLQLKGYEKPLLTSYAPSYDPDNDPGARVNRPWKMNFDRFIPEGAVFFLPASIDDFEALDTPIPSRFYSAHFAFTIGDFVNEVPHDPNYYFHGEEISIAVRAFTWGYDLFHPHKVIVWHEYTRKKRTKHWDNHHNWHEYNKLSHLRNRKLFEMDGEKRDIDFGRYGFGTHRSLNDYEKWAGISFGNRSIQKWTLDNLPPPNPVVSDEHFEGSLVRNFKYCINIDRQRLVKMNYDFIAVIFEDKFGNSLNRKDLVGYEINSLFLSGKQNIEIWRSFEVETQPYRWIVWPHTKEDGWLLRLEGIL